jgi:hypothetical protein
VKQYLLTRIFIRLRRERKRVKLEKGIKQYNLNRIQTPGASTDWQNNRHTEGLTVRMSHASNELIISCKELNTEIIP